MAIPVSNGTVTVTRLVERRTWLINIQAPTDDEALITVKRQLQTTEDGVVVNQTALPDINRDLLQILGDSITLPNGMPINIAMVAYIIESFCDLWDQQDLDAGMDISDTLAQIQAAQLAASSAANSAAASAITAGTYAQRAQASVTSSTVYGVALATAYAGDAQTAVGQAEAALALAQNASFLCSQATDLPSAQSSLADAQAQASLAAVAASNALIDANNAAQAALASGYSIYGSPSPFSPEE
jgi:hypothetical protein